MKNKLLLFIILLFISAPHISRGQVCPPNIDFEQCNMSGWQFWNGLVTAADPPFYSWGTPPAPVGGVLPVVGRETLVTGSAPGDVDAICGFPLIPPGGGTYALKLGSNVNGLLSERAQYNVHVASSL
jgi:hypothetical protein